MDFATNGWDASGDGYFANDESDEEEVMVLGSWEEEKPTENAIRVLAGAEVCVLHDETVVGASCEDLLEKVTIDEPVLKAGVGLHG